MTDNQTMSKPREFWIRNTQEIGPIKLPSDLLFATTKPPEYEPKPYHESIHVIEYSAYEAILKHNAHQETVLVEQGIEVQELRRQLAAAKTEIENLKDPEYHKLVLEAVKALRYIKGIVERGENRKVAGNEPIEKAILEYVKKLEKQLEAAKAENEGLKLKIKNIYENGYTFEKLCLELAAEKAKSAKILELLKKESKLAYQAYESTFDTFEEYWEWFSKKEALAEHSAGNESSKGDGNA